MLISDTRRAGFLEGALVKHNRSEITGVGGVLRRGHSEEARYTVVFTEGVKISAYRY
jgi:hypothetical protein